MTVFCRKRILLFSLLIAVLVSGTAEAGGVVLALSGGGSRGLAHIGVIEVLQEEGIPIVGIVGTSMGAISGGLVASGYSPEELRRIFSEMDMANILTERVNPIYLPQGHKGPAPKGRISWITVTDEGKTQGPTGILSGVGVLEMFSDLVSRVEITRFDELPIPFAAVATDLETGEKVVLQSGNLAEAMRASMAIPALFAPWPMGDTKLVDGGIVSNLPVNTARELFPGYPVIAVDVSGKLRDDSEIRSVLDVVDQALNILTRRNVQEEIRNADLVLSPPVKGHAILDFSRAEEIMDDGRATALRQIGAIRSIAADAPPPPQRIPLDIRSTVSALKVEGATARLGERIVSRYSHWIGNPLDLHAVSRASTEIGKLENVQVVNYRLDEAGPDVEIVFIVHRKPKFEMSFGGYITNLHPYRWLYASGIRRGLIHDDDLLQFNMKIAEQWGADLSYLTSSDLETAWEVLFSAQKWELNTLNQGNKSWYRYALGVSKRFPLGDWGAEVGFAGEYVDGKHQTSDSYGPTFSLLMNTLDSATDPTSGTLFSLHSWWPDGEEILYRATYFKAMKMRSNWRVYLRLGYAEGDESGDGRHGVFLGGAEELYSYANRPIQGERMFWANLAFRMMVMKSWWGSLYMEGFGGLGYVFNDGGTRIKDAWELGIALSVPGFLLDGKLMFLYDDEGDFKVGFTIGNPIWGHYPLP